MGKDLVEADGRSRVVESRTFEGVKLVLSHKRGVPELGTQRGSGIRLAARTRWDVWKEEVGICTIGAYLGTKSGQPPMRSVAVREKLCSLIMEWYPERFGDLGLLNLLMIPWGCCRLLLWSILRRACYGGKTQQGQKR